MSSTLRKNNKILENPILQIFIIVCNRTQTNVILIAPLLFEAQIQRQNQVKKSG